MTATYIINGGIIDTVVYDDVELVESAEMGTVGTGHVTVRDDDGLRLISGLKSFQATENDCSDAITLKGQTGSRTYSRGTAETSNARFIDVEVKDQNILLGQRALRGPDAKRPRETVGARLTWLLSTPELGDLVANHGRVSLSSAMIDQADHRKTYPGDVLAECAIAAGGWNYYVYTDQATGDASLSFRDDNAVTSNTSVLRISNVYADLAVSSNTLFPLDTTRLTRDPSSVFSRVAVPYARGTVWRERAATASNFRRVDGIAPSAHVKRRTKAIEIADAYLTSHATEEDIIECPIPQVQADQVNLVHAGDRIAAKFSHYTTEGYGTFTNFRVLERRVRPLLTPAAPALYDMDLKLSPQEVCSVQPSFVQYRYQDNVSPGSTFPHWTWRSSIAAATGVGNLIGLMIITDGLNSGVMSEVPAGWSSAFMNTNVKADQSGSWCSLFYKKAEGETYVDLLTTGSVSPPRVIWFEYTGLMNPVLYSQTAVNRQNVGSADIPTIPYPAGPSLVLGLNYMQEGPQSGDHIVASGTGNNLRTPQDSALPSCNSVGYPGYTDNGNCFLGHPCLSISDAFRPVGGSSGSYTSWHITNTGAAPTMTIGIVFTGDTC